MLKKQPTMFLFLTFNRSSDSKYKVFYKFLTHFWVNTPVFSYLRHRFEVQKRNRLDSKRVDALTMTADTLEQRIYYILSDRPGFSFFILFFEIKYNNRIIIIVIIIGFLRASTQNRHHYLVQVL